MYTYVATAILAAALSATGTWKVQQWRMDAKEKEHVEQILDAERRAAAKALRNQETVIAAQSEAARRAADLRRDAAGSRDALVGLSHATDQTLRDAAASLDACTDSASKLKVVFLECSRNYEEVARDADNWENDAVMLRDAWPK